MRIKNPYTVTLDVLFGCPGWLQGMIRLIILSTPGDAKKILVIGAETLSRVSDPHDIDSMIYSDGAGAALVEATNRKECRNLIPYNPIRYLSGSLSVAAWAVRMALNPDPNRLFLKMDGHEIYKYAVKPWRIP